MEISEFLNSINLSDLFPIFVENGFEDMDILEGNNKKKIKEFYKNILIRNH